MATEFETSVRDWVAQNLPAPLAGARIDMYGVVSGDPAVKDAFDLWRRRLAAQGWGAPTWPVEYGGAGLTDAQAKVVSRAIAKAGSMNPIPYLSGMGVTMVGPTLLEYGTPEQKTRHLPGMASGEVRWCLGLSEPNAGSDLASLTTSAELDDEGWVLNGQKTWTSGADKSQWCGVLVRTDRSAAKRDGISFLMLEMKQPGIVTRPISLIAGESPFCETFFTNARARKDDLLGKLNDGWSVVKRLLQHERQSQTTAPATTNKVEPLQDIAKRYLGSNADGTLADADLRSRLADHLMDTAAHELTIARIMTDARGGNLEVTATASILKNSATDSTQGRSELLLEIMGNQGVGWETGEYTEEEVRTAREWLGGKAMSIYGGSYEVQKNIIAKNILGLPETTQKG
ncbi:MAG: acyl-CoA dehydrogenase family protein [Haliea sp.]|jgi:alkylation response protein AidB-like acyl-CoA dehydrogenase|nr:acyl-CoA dehydrogenase family protein [Haliea sp.]